MRLNGRQALRVAAATLTIAAASTSFAQIWSIDGTEEARRARALEEMNRAAAARGEVGPASAASASASAPAPATLPNGSFTAAPAASSPAPRGAASAPSSSASASAASSGLRSVIEPRAYGLTLGDLITQRIALPRGTPALQNAAFDLRVGRVGTWLERRHARRETDVDGRDWLVIEHQIVNVAKLPRHADIPPMQLALQGGGALSIAPATFDIDPIAVVGGRNVHDALQAMRADRAPPAADVPAAWWRLRMALGLLGVTLLGWLLWWRWREWRDARSKPFARALHALRHDPMAASGPRGWVTLHHALNAAAGRSVHAGSLDPLFDAQPALRGERESIDAFFAASNARFFAQADTPAPFDLLAFARSLRRIEARTS